MTPEAYLATIRLGLVLSSLAAVCTVVLSTIGEVSRWSLVASVMVIGSVASWVQSGRTMHAADRAPVMPDSAVGRRFG